jgi:2-oxoglutarate ferredoxin oxidoreductase subunit gamma
MYSIIIAGSGGQGILFVGKLLAQAAMLEGRNVTWFPSYGAEMRGGTANCTVIISDGHIGSPIVRHPDILIAMNEASFKRFEGSVKKGGMIIVDTSMVALHRGSNGVKVSGLPAGELAIALNAPLAANMVMAGALAATAGICSKESLLRALDELTPARRRKALPANRKALEKGWTSV